MSISISIGTTGNEEAGVGPVGYSEACEQEFETVGEAIEFLLPYKRGMYEEDWKTIISVLEYASEGKEVDPELGIRNERGQWTNFHISIRGHQNVSWEALKAELTRAINELNESGAYRRTEAREWFIELLSDAYAVPNSILQHKAKGGPESGPLGEDHEPIKIPYEDE